MAYWALGGDYVALGEPRRAAEYYTKAFLLRDHASERERLAITAEYHDTVTGELDKAAQIYQEEIAELPAGSGRVCAIGRLVLLSGAVRQSG